MWNYKLDLFYNSVNDYANIRRETPYLVFITQKIAMTFQAGRVAFCKLTDFIGGPYRLLHDGGVGAGSQPNAVQDISPMGLLPDTQTSELRMHRECFLATDFKWNC